jgi:hypothetical protein
MNFPFLKAKERLIRIMGTFDLATGHADTFDELLDSLESELRDVLGHYREQNRNSRTMIDTAIEMERERVAKLLEYLDMKAQPYHSYYKHAAKVINGKPEEGGLI